VSLLLSYDCFGLGDLCAGCVSQEEQTLDAYVFQVGAKVFHWHEVELRRDSQEFRGRLNVGAVSASASSLAVLLGVEFVKASCTSHDLNMLSKPGKRRDLQDTHLLWEIKI
jgi:hypothetical protein